MSVFFQNGVDDDGTDDILLESPDSGKHRENELDQLMDAIDTEGSECCVLNNITLVRNKCFPFPSLPVFHPPLFPFSFVVIKLLLLLLFNFGNYIT